VIGQGTPETLQRENSPRVSQFMQGLADGPVPFHFPADNVVNDLLLIDQGAIDQEADKA